MTVIVTRNVPDRFRGFLTSCMLEVAPGVYTNPRMSEGVRERVWSVCEEWSDLLPPDGGLLLTWRDVRMPSGQGLLTIGFPKAEIVHMQGVWLSRRPSDEVVPDANVEADSSDLRLT